MNQKELEVWYGSMPESNGKKNYTVLLKRMGHNLISDYNITFYRSEYPGRAQYEADRLRYLIGELKEEPCVLDYDTDEHSGYVKKYDEMYARGIVDSRNMFVHGSVSWKLLDEKLQSVFEGGE